MNDQCGNKMANSNALGKHKLITKGSFLVSGPHEVIMQSRVWWQCKTHEQAVSEEWSIVRLGAQGMLILHKVLGGQFVEALMHVESQDVGASRCHGCWLWHVVMPHISLMHYGGVEQKVSNGLLGLILELLWLDLEKDWCFKKYIGDSDDLYWC